MAKITNRTFSSKNQDWAADVIIGGTFAYRVSSTVTAGIQTVRLARIDAEGRKAERVATTTSVPPMGFDTVEAWVDETVKGL